MQVTERFARLIKQHLDEAVSMQHIPAVDTEVVAHAWMGAIYSLMIQWVYTGEPTSERILNALVPLLLRSVEYAE